MASFKDFQRCHLFKASYAVGHYNQHVHRSRNIVAALRNFDTIFFSIFRHNPLNFFMRKHFLYIFTTCATEQIRSQTFDILIPRFSKIHSALHKNVSRDFYNASQYDSRMELIMETKVADSVHSPSYITLTLYTLPLCFIKILLLRMLDCLK